MRKYLFILTLLTLSLSALGQQTVNIKGHVNFITDNFKISAVRYDGPDVIELASTLVDPSSHLYSLDVPLKEVGQAVITCDKWQRVNVWLEDENLEINFRGVDTAKVKINNPPYVHIKGGKNNELMNLANYLAYQNYQSMIAISQTVYGNKDKFSSENGSQTLANALYNNLSDRESATYKYFVEHYADRNSVLYLINRMNYDKNKSLIDQTLKRLQACSPTAGPLVERYYQVNEEKRQRLALLNVGARSPELSFVDVKGNKKHLSDYFGKVLVLDFWASWCGPCRAEIPKMKAIYKDIDHKQVEFLSVSIDSKKDDWTKALGEEAMPWQQAWVTDSGKEAMKTYMFNGIPYILVIDKQGNIFKKGVRGEAIRKAIMEAVK